METIRQLPSTLRETFRRVNAEGAPWIGTALIAALALCLVGVGWTLGTWYCDYRMQQQASLLRQALTIGVHCVPDLGQMGRTAVILARNERPVPLPPTARLVDPIRVRDSLRVVRWTTPPVSADSEP